MNSTKLTFGFALIAFCYILLSFSLKCYVCNSKDSCKKPQMHECNQKLARETLSYLEKNHTGVDPNAVSTNYECFKEYIYTSSAWSYYKGCIYSNIIGCKLALVPYNSSTLNAHECYQCGGKDGCNPAGRTHVDVITVFSTIAVAVFLRSIWH